MSVVYHQCTKCELRFTTKWELEKHLELDHPPDGPEPPLIYDDEDER